MTIPIPLGVDPGNGAIKVYGPHGGVQLPAIVAADTQGGIGGSAVIRAAGLATGKPPLHVRMAGGAFYLGARYECAHVDSAMGLFTQQMIEAALREPVEQWDL